VVEVETVVVLVEVLVGTEVDDEVEVVVTTTFATPVVCQVPLNM
jgi:hypothetical protein